MAPAGFSGRAWSGDGRAIYFVGRDPRDHSVAVWRLPAAGGVPRPVARFNLGDQQSDLRMAGIAGSR